MSTWCYSAITVCIVADCYPRSCSIKGFGWAVGSDDEVTSGMTKGGCIDDAWALASLWTPPIVNLGLNFNFKS
eukprot:CAMPEP_0204177266 /NCGR_PEP_ID=MMETSP0361-20130328/48338_1 /ASSEMBLY_ACC=CAM_ASM_000343 /TAXON_ID=268821 /ORGANISM="Scrippsiella Hangoei, Strain SHTV-5" /LENGTH=72 /DNA_ID=CAMNT_0051136213 /DNA_START=150 /DNA_END=368 /DNA_ORIENTATION=+